jgi:hypothetical protein
VRTLGPVAFRLARGLVALTAALVLTGVAGTSVQAFDGCFSALSTDRDRPACCGMAKKDRIGKQRVDCCSKAELVRQEPGSSTSPTPPVPGAPVVTLPLSLVAAFGDVLVEAQPPLARDGPPDERPPTDTTVLLL